MSNPAAYRIAEWRADPVRFVVDCFGATPDAWQAKALAAFAENRRCCMMASKGPGKLQPYQVAIETPQGKRRWGDLQVGDEVFADDGTATKIVARHEHGVKQIVRMVFDDGSSVRCGLEHLWKCRGIGENQYGTWSVLTTQQILDRGVIVRLGGSRWYRQFQIPKAGPAQYPRAELPVDPYLLGSWLGNGSLGRNLKELGLYDKRSWEKSIPEMYLRSGVDQRTDLLRGICDTDGTFVADSGFCEYYTASEMLADDVVFLVRSLGGKSWLDKTKKAPYYRDAQGDKVFRVRLTTDFCPFSAESKAENWHAPTHECYLLREIDRIDPDGFEESMCIEVENPSHCYLAENFTVTHNSTVLAWEILNFLMTRPHPMVPVTSISAENLADGLWTELSRWVSKSALCRKALSVQKKEIVHKEHPDTWKVMARTWPKDADASQQANTLAGKHADYMLFVLDEVGGIPDSVMAAAEAGLATGVETKLSIAGNPTHTEGPLYRAVTTESHLWHVISVNGDPDNPDRSPRISKEWAREQIEKYGKDNPWVQVNVFGRFPQVSINALLGVNDVDAAMKRQPRPGEYEWAQKRLGIDVARFGADSSVMFPRQGIVAFNPVELKGAAADEVSGRVLVAKHKWGSECEFVDGTGGYGGGVCDFLRVHGASPVEVNFSGKAQDPRYFNARSEMWFRMAEWVKNGGCLPRNDQLRKELVAPTYTFQGGKFRLEDKDHIKKRLGYSPDFADALALTFFLPDIPGRADIPPEIASLLQRETGKVSYENDPLSTRNILGRD